MVFFLSACGGDPPNPPADRCAGVRCSGSDYCEPVSGLCVAPDGGVRVDAGVDAGLDAGVMDAGVDGGLLDAGVDAGQLDAGFDAGLDAGVEDAGQPDAGCTGDPECGGFLKCDLPTGRCVECRTSADCLSPSIPSCDVRTNSCVACVSNLDCANPLPICDGTNQCLPCNNSAECGPGRECNAITFACDLLNDTCASARTILPMGTGLFTMLADPAQALDDTTLGCGSGGPELVYTFTTTSTQSLTVTSTPTLGSPTRPALALRAACTGSATACDAPTSGAAAISVASLPAGTWFLFVEAASGTTGPVILSVQLQSPPTTAANDTCAAALTLGANATSVTHSVVLGNTVVGTNESTTEPTCSATARSGPDLWYRLTLGARANLNATVRPLTGSTLHPVISLQSACAAGTELACRAGSTSASLTLQQANVMPGTYFLGVDSADATQGEFQLEVDVTPVVDNDACSAPTALTFTSGAATATGDTSFATNGNAMGDVTPGCSSSARSTGRDLVYSYTLAQAQDVTVRVTPTGASPSYEPVLSVRAANCTDGAASGEKGCASPVASTPATLSLVNQAAGTYFVWVDSGRDTAGPFQLEVTLAPATPPPANDACAMPQQLSFTNQVASFSGSTLQAANDNYPADVTPTCSPSAKQFGRDVVFQFTTTQVQDVLIDVAPASGSTLIPAVYVRRTNCGSQVIADEMFCDAEIGGVHGRMVRLPAGTFFLWVDSSGATSGAFSGTLTLTTPSPAPANDACPGEVLVFDGGVASTGGSTVAAGNSNSPTDNAPACGTDFYPRRFGRDLVYSYTLASAADVDVLVTPTSSAFLPAVYVRVPNACTSLSAGSELACVAQTQSAPVSVFLPNQAPGTYSLYVDSNSIDTGTFSLRVTQRPATPPPGNDSCTAPTALTLGTPVTGDTRVATNGFSLASYAAACRGTALLDGRDLVYAFSAPMTGTVTAAVVPEASFNPTLLLLQSSCAPAQCVRKVDASGPGVPESFAFAVTQGQTYYLAVDSASSEVPGAFGSFTLTVQ